MSQPAIVEENVLEPVDEQALEVMFKALATTPPTTDAELLFYVKTILGVDLPRYSVSGDGASSPAQFVCDVFFERVRHVIVLAARDSMKTLCLSIIHFLNSIFKPGCGTCTVGAVEKQADKCHDYVSGFCRRKWSQVHPVMAKLPPNDPSGGFVFGPAPGPIIDSIQVQTIHFVSGSEIEILPATMNKVSGPHPQKAAADEVDMWSWKILMKWWGMAAQGKTKYAAQRILTSTRDTMTGVMNRLLEEAEQRDLVVYRWNVFDVMKSCRKTHGRCLCKNKAGKVTDKSACILWDAGCEGKAERAAGGKPYQEVVDLRRGCDDETWKAQHLCSRPARHTLVYHEFDELSGFVSEMADYDPAKGPIYLSVDPGWTDPYAVLFMQMTKWHLDIFDEIYLQRVRTKEVKRMIYEGVWPATSPSGDHRFTTGRKWLEVGSGEDGELVYTNLEKVIVDYHDQDTIVDWLDDEEVDGVYVPGYPAEAAAVVHIVPRLRAVRNRLKVEEHGPLLRVHPRCRNTIWEFTVGYKYKVDAATGNPVGEEPEDRNNHCMDGVGQFIVTEDSPAPRVWRLFGSETDEDPDEAPESSE